MAAQDHVRQFLAMDDADDVLDVTITSSARASTVVGMVMPSALAVLRLTMSSYRVGCSTGRSAGFAPLRMRSM